MKLQKQTLIALLATLELARDPARQVSVSEIADAYGVSVNHLAKVMRDLGRAGLVEAVRGVGGGYRFAGNAKRISLYDVISLFENISGDWSNLPPSGGGGELPDSSGESDIGRALSAVLREVDEIAIATFKSISLATLIKSLERARARAGESAEKRPNSP